VASLNCQAKGGSVTVIAHLERLVTSLTILGLSQAQIAERTRLNATSVKKLLENVSRKIDAAKTVEREKA